VSAVAAGTPVTGVAAAAGPAPASDRRAWVEQVMGMPVSVHARGAGARAARTAGAVRDLLADLHDAEAMVSTDRPDSEIRRLQRGDLTLADCSPQVREVEVLCRTALARTAGAFDAWAAVPGRPGVFDPTGLVKSWAVAQAARRLEAVPDVAFAVGAGGDVLVRSGGQDRDWTVGIEDPRDRSQVLARVPVRDGAVATSGSAARGEHIVDPRSGRPARGVLQATVVGPSLLWADVFATASVALGTDALGWVDRLHGTSGLLVLADGRIHRWQNEP
jgi:thiamine biosynthesis lipoprotein